MIPKCWPAKLHVFKDVKWSSGCCNCKWFQSRTFALPLWDTLMAVMGYHIHKIWDSAHFYITCKSLKVQYVCRFLQFKILYTQLILKIIICICKYFVFILLKFSLYSNSITHECAICIVMIQKNLINDTSLPLIHMQMPRTVQIILNKLKW